MSATHGSARRLRSRSRLLGCALVALIALSAVMASSAGATPPIKETYMALGDSLAFGYSQQLFNEHIGTGEPASAFEHGYANDYLVFLHPTTAPRKQLQDLGCPGETSGSLIGNGALEAGLKAARELETGKAVPPFGEAPCAYHELGAEELNAKFGGGLYPAGYKFPLHTEYGGAGVSQLEAAVYWIARDAAEGKPVTHLSINIGPNDQLHAVKHCEEKVGEEVVKGEIPPTKEAEEKALKSCLEASVPGLIGQIATNLDTTLFVLQNGSLFGGINYEGKIIYVGAYNPYGNLLKFPTKKEAAEGKNYEVLKGSNELAKVISTAIGYYGAKGGACPALTFDRFNTETTGEPLHLQKWTNMANTSETEFPPLSGNKLKNGPDIHATPEGYKIMASWMYNECGT
ncbi:MAG TPA: hypothetical protein VKG82_00845 [Solirubrobacteraceae bacterium]|nr:hypothetical protein [Solirubrobacteraceae bacterium]